MLIFRSILFVIIFCGLFLNAKEAKIKRLGVLIAFGYIFFISAFRGGFTTDYRSYVRIFEWFSNVDFVDFFTPTLELYYTEKGYGLLNYIVSRFTNNPQAIFVITSGIVLWPYYKYANETQHKFLFLLLFISFGPLFQSFNVTRQAVAASICCMAYPHLVKGNIKKYMLLIVVAGTFHVSAFLLIPFYFLFRMRITRMNLCIQIAGISFVYLFYEQLLRVADDFLFGGKYETYKVTMVEGIQSVIVPAMITLFIFIVLRYQSRQFGGKIGWKDDMLFSEEKSRELAVSYNGTVYWFLTFLFSLRTYYFYRLGLYFCIFPMMAVINTLDSMTNNRDKKLLIFIFILCLSLYYLLFGQYFGDYEFCFKF